MIAYQALLIEEFAKAGTTVMFVKGPRSDSPEDALLVQFQGMIAEYERAQIMERTRRGKAHRAKSGTINVLSGAPFGYRYIRKSEHAEARYEIVAHEAAIVAELFARYADGGVAIGELARWLSGLGVVTRTGKPRWTAPPSGACCATPPTPGGPASAKRCAPIRPPGSPAAPAWPGAPRPAPTRSPTGPASDWLEIPVPALVAEDTWQRVQRRLADNKRYATRNSTNPSLLQGICACSSCGYAYYRTSTRTTNKKIYYYRCLGSDDYRYEHGRVCANKPVRADYLDTVVWNHITALLADPALIRNEINKRLEQVRTVDPATAQRQRLDAGLAKATTAITRLIGAYQEELISLDELRTRMPELRARQTSLHHQIDALDSQLADREVYLKLADNLEDFLTGLRGKAATATVAERQRVLRLLVKDVLVGVGSGFGGVGEERVIAPYREQRVWVAGIFDAAHDQPRGDRGVGGRESGVGDFGDLGVGDPVAGVGVTDRARITHRGPRAVLDRRDRRPHRGVLGHDEGEPGTGASARVHHGAGAVGRVAADQDLPGRARGAGGGDGLGDHACGALAGAGPPGAQPHTRDHRRGQIGADGGRQRRQTFAEHLFAGDLGVPIGGALLVVPVGRAQQRVDIDEGAHLGTGQHIDVRCTVSPDARAAPTPIGGRARN